MDTARAVRAHIIRTSIALVLIAIASCWTYVFLAKVPECQRIKFLNESSFTGHFNNSQQWLLKASNHTENRLVWENEWEYHRNESILNNKTWIVIRETGDYLVYIQANFVLEPEKGFVDLRLQVVFDHGGENEEIFSVAHDTVETSSDKRDAKLSTFLLMYLQQANKLSVKVFPSDMVNYSARPFSTFITIVKWAGN